MKLHELEPYIIAAGGARNMLCMPCAARAGDELTTPLGVVKVVSGYLVVMQLSADSSNVPLLLINAVENLKDALIASLPTPETPFSTLPCDTTDSVEHGTYTLRGITATFTHYVTHTADWWEVAAMAAIAK